MTKKKVVVGLVPVATPAHDATQSHKYVMHFPEHLPRADDPHYKAFAAYHRATAAAAKCYVGLRVGFDACAGGLELHHAVIEFSLANGVDLTAMQVDFPNLKDDAAVQEWIESEPNLRWICAFHHRGHAGAHVASHADWSAGQYIKELIS